MPPLIFDEFVHGVLLAFAFATMMLVQVTALWNPPAFLLAWFLHRGPMWGDISALVVAYAVAILFPGAASDFVAGAVEVTMWYIVWSLFAGPPGMLGAWWV